VVELLVASGRCAAKERGLRAPAVGCMARQKEGCWADGRTRSRWHWVGQRGRVTREPPGGGGVGSSGW
jgi:hypothetical protein